jgi:DNA-binding MarR family transcriptional regulator
MPDDLRVSVEKNLQRVEDAVEGLGRLFQGQGPAALRAQRAGVDLSRTAQKLLWHVATEAPIRISDLARDVGMADALVSRQITALEKRGLVERLASPDDLRVSLVRPTAKGRAAGRKLRRAADEIFREQLSDWSARDLQGLAGHLERLLVDLRRRPR